VNPGLEVFTKCRIEHSFSRSGWNPVSAMAILTIGSSIASVSLPRGGVVRGSVVCGVCSGVMVVTKGEGEEGFWRLRGDSLGSSPASCDLTLAILGKGDTTEGRTKGDEGGKGQRLQQRRTFYVTNKFRQESCNYSPVTLASVL
jgi:hypothetical protein